VTRLIINADDFGLTSGVNRAILELLQAGALTSATLMARAAATEEAVEMAKATPSLGVGCHVVLVDGEPVLSGVQDIPNLADPVCGRFKATLTEFLRGIYNPLGGSRYGATIAQKVDYQIESEARAQIQLLQSRGVQLTHIDTHKHTHMFPQVLRPVLRAARACGIHSVRNPFEPAWSVAATPGAPLTRRVQVRLLRVLERSFRRVVAEEGFKTTNGALGVLATGTLDERTVVSLLSALPDGGVYELVTHPGYNDGDLARANTRLLASRETEREALCFLRQPNLEGRAPALISFSNV
jgi:predicted glycoside hydrolase/deacetylase ChbG (UPF0249 family)